VGGLATRHVFVGGGISGTPPATGTWTPDGSPVAIDAGSGHKAFPGAAWLDATRLLLVYRTGTSHLAGGDINGRIGAVSGTSVSWGSEFTIYDHATLDLRCEDAVSVIDDKVVIAGRTYNGSVNDAPFVLICDDAPADCDSSSTWTKHDITFSEGTSQNATQGRVLKVGSSYVLGMAAVDTGPVYDIGVIVNGSLTDWSSPTWKLIGTGYTEIAIDVLWNGDILALLRTASGSTTYDSTSKDSGATWSTPASAHDGFGFPMFRRLTDTTLLTVYRDSPDGDTAWRTSDDDGETWSSEAILDSTGTRNTYATLAQLDNDNVLAIYAIEGSGGSSATDSDLYSQVFTRS
jgi:hypothetical protein